FVSLRQLLGLGANAFFLGPELGTKLGAEILGLKYLANFDISLLVMGIGTAFQPPDRLFHRFTLPNPKPGEQLLRFGERTIDHGPLTSRKSDTHAFRARLQSLARKHHTGFH